MVIVGRGMLTRWVGRLLEPFSGRRSPFSQSGVSAQLYLVSDMQGSFVGYARGEVAGTIGVSDMKRELGILCNTQGKSAPLVHAPYRPESRSTLPGGCRVTPEFHNRRFSTFI